MSASRLRQSIFPNIPPYLTFIGPEESYEEGEECPEELVIHFTVAQWSSLTVRETIMRSGARIVEVRLLIISSAVTEVATHNEPLSPRYFISVELGRVR